LTALTGWYIVHAGLSTPTPPSVVRARILHGMVVVLVFAVSIPIAFASPAIAKYSWLLMIPLGVAAGRISGPDDE
jgi:Na+-transporting NADH:ubiquinone oxidoreductase subunit NqrB